MLINQRTLLWLVPILITIHNLEEALFMPAMIEARNAAFPKAFSGWLSPIASARQLFIGLLIVTVLPYFVAWNANWESGLRGKMLLCLQAAMLINVFAHVGMTIFIGGYAPGVVTAVLFNLPFSFYLFHRVRQAGWVSNGSLIRIGFIGLLLHVVALPVIILLAGKLARY